MMMMIVVVAMLKMNEKHYGKGGKPSTRMIVMMTVLVIIWIIIWLITYRKITLHFACHNICSLTHALLHAEQPLFKCHTLFEPTSLSMQRY